MHPGGTNIIKSNGGVDCTKSFDLLAHTNNPEVSSLLTKYYIGELTPKPAYHSEELSMLYDLWKGYLRVATEQVVASHFEVGMIMESSTVWFQGNLFNMGGVRRFYHYQSRLLQGGFSALFGAKLQELYLKLSFTLANTSSSNPRAKLPDILGVVAHAKGSKDAIKCSSEISQIGQFTCDSESARHHEKGIIAYAQRSVQYDMEFLEVIRKEACAGMDAFDVIMDLDATSDMDRVGILSAFLLQILERMAKRLEAFYVKLAQYSVFHPALERNPARARWSILKRKIWDGSFFILTRETSLLPEPAHQHQFAQHGVEFDQVVSQIERTLNVNATHSSPRTMDLNEQHAARAMATPGDLPVYEHQGQANALKAMSDFVSSNKKDIRRLSRLPQTIDLENLKNTYGTRLRQSNTLPTPPSSRSSSTSSSPGPFGRQRLRALSSTMNQLPYTEDTIRGRCINAGPRMPPPSPPERLSPAATMSALMKNMNLRQSNQSQSRPLSPARSVKSSSNVMTEHDRRVQSMRSLSLSERRLEGNVDARVDVESAHGRSRSTTSNLRSFRLQASALAAGLNRRYEGSRS